MLAVQRPFTTLSPHDPLDFEAALKRNAGLTNGQPTPPMSPIDISRSSSEENLAALNKEDDRLPTIQEEDAAEEAAALIVTKRDIVLPSTNPDIHDIVDLLKNGTGKQKAGQPPLQSPERRLQIAIKNTPDNTRVFSILKGFLKPGSSRDIRLASLITLHFRETDGALITLSPSGHENKPLPPPEKIGEIVAEGSGSVTLNEDVTRSNTDNSNSRPDASTSSNIKQPSWWRTASKSKKKAVIGLSVIIGGLVAGISVFGNQLEETRKNAKKLFQKNTELAAFVPQSTKKINTLAEEINRLQAEVNRLRRL